MFLVDQVSRLVENINTGIFLDTITVTNVKLYMTVLYIKLYVFMIVPVILTSFQGYEYTALRDFGAYSREIIDVFPDLTKTLS